MAQPARTLSTSTEPTEPQRMSTDDTGRFAIDSSERGTMLPPAEEGAVEMLSLEDLGGSLIESAPRTAPPPPPKARAAAAPVSGVFRSGEADVETAFAERIISLSPIYTQAETAQSERAVLEIEDLSLRPDNPYLASSLVPPTEHTSRGNLLAVGAAVLALLGGGAVWYSSHGVQAPVARPRASAMRQGHRVATSAPALTLAAPTPAQAAAVPAPVTTAAANPVVEHALPVAASLKPTPAKARVVASASAVQAAEAPAPARAGVAPGSAVVPAAAEASTAQPAVPALEESLPALPTREQVVAGFDSVRAQLEQCAAGQHGVASVAATVASSGRVSYALVQGKFAGTPEGSCMALAVRQAHFPRFTQASLKVVYPFSL
jgi:hypothetical protein